MDLELSGAQLRILMEAGGPHVLIDVREPWEHQLVRLPNDQLIPMAYIPMQLDSLRTMAAEDSSRPLIFYCHHGIRSLQVVSWLRSQGIANTVSLRGGIDGWARDIDPEMESY